MTEEREQKELFEFAEQKKPFPRFTNILPKPDFEGRVALTLTLEKMIFISIGIIMAMVVVFAWGVEKGKSRNPIKKFTEPAMQKAAQAVAVPPIAAAQPQSSEQKSFFSTAPAALNVKTVPQKSVAATSKAAVAPESSKPYTIVAATFSKIETAQATAAFLNKRGFDSSVAYSEPYYKVCVGAYADMYGTQIKSDLVKVKRIYKDAYMRLR